MVILSQDDLYQVKKASLIADYDRQTLNDLYMPIVGYTAISIYFSLWAEAEKSDINNLKTHNHLLVSMQIATGKFVEERQKLEALGLLRTNIAKHDMTNIYTYRIYAPKTPERFFNNSLLYGTLIKFVGEAEASRLKSQYTIEDEYDYGSDISASFGKIYSPDLSDPVYRKTLEIKSGKILDRLQSKVDAEFNYKRFIDLVKKQIQVNEAVFTKKVLKELERLTALYGVGEESAADCFAKCYCPDAPRGQKVDFKLLTEMFQDEIKFPFLAKPSIDYEDRGKISSNSNLAKKINMMEEMSCKDYLQVKQNNTIPVPSDLKLVNDLSLKLGLKPAVINAIIDYSLAKNNNILSRNFVEKIAASLAREKITTAYDAMVYLSNKKSTHKKVVNYKLKDEGYDKENENISSNNEQDDDFDEEEWNKMLERIGGN